MENIQNDPLIIKAKELLKACEEAPGGHLNAYLVQEIVRLVRDAGGTFFDIGTTAEHLRALGGMEIQTE